jgi:hypothetical protein
LSDDVLYLHCEGTQNASGMSFRIIMLESNRRAPKIFKDEENLKTLYPSGIRTMSSMANLYQDRGFPRIRKSVNTGIWIVETNHQTQRSQRSVDLEELKVQEHV